MSEKSFVLAIDQGTTSTRAILFDRRGARSRDRASAAHADLSRAGTGRARSRGDLAVGAARRPAGARARSDVNSIAAIGITNQRETTVVWERATGKPLANAIVWQDRRTAPLCAELAQEGWGAHVAEATGLVIDPYFSATKLAWLLRDCAGPRCASAGRGGVLRHDRQLPAVQAHRRQAACDRRDQRRAHHALRHSVRALGRPAARTAFGAARHAAGGARQPERFRSRAAGAFRRRDSDQRAWSAISRRLPTARPASRPAWSRRPSAPAASCSPIPARRKWPRPPACSRPSSISSTASALTRWKARSSWPARRCNGCGTISASSPPPQKARPWRERQTRTRASISFPPFRDWARRSGMRARAPPFSD